MPTYKMPTGEVEERLAALNIDHSGNTIFGVPRGGACAAAYLCHAHQTPYPQQATHILDDIIDSGATLQRLVNLYPKKPFAALVDKRKPEDKDLGWVVFPWEPEQESGGPADAVIRLIEYVGEDPKREGLLDTPRRVLAAYKELTSGYGMEPQEILKTTFDIGTDEMVILKGIRFTSLCEHHLLPFSGIVTVAYLPGKRLVGISKLARLVECYARRFQVQERLTFQIADAIKTCLGAKGVGVVVRAHHECMGCRGVKQPDAEMITSCMLGAMREKPAARAELLGLE